MLSTRYSRSSRFLSDEQSEQLNDLRETIFESLSDEQEKRLVEVKDKVRITRAEGDFQSLSDEQREQLAELRDKVRVRRDEFISDEQKQNLTELKEIVEANVDNRPTKEDIKATLKALKNITSDGTITDQEKQEIVTGIQAKITNLGITASEAYDRMIVAQQVIADSRLPQTSETHAGTTENDLLLGLGGDDILVGTSNNGQGEIDVLRGGAGSDQFILGSDFALIMDFNIAEDSIQLNGSADNYSLGAIPDSLQNRFPNLEGTALYYQDGGQTSSKLVGVFLGTDVTTLEQTANFV